MSLQPCPSPPAALLPGLPVGAFSSLVQPSSEVHRRVCKVSSCSAPTPFSFPQPLIHADAPSWGKEASSPFTSPLNE